MLKKPIQVQLAELEDAYCLITQAWRVQLHNYKRMTCAAVQLRLKSGLQMTNQIREFWYSYDYDYYYIYYFYYHNYYYILHF